MTDFSFDILTLILFVSFYIYNFKFSYFGINKLFYLQSYHNQVLSYLAQFYIQSLLTSILLGL